MSYCRFGPDSDVYLYRTLYGNDIRWECCACSMEKPFGSTISKTLKEALVHLHDHEKRGDRVPAGAINRLRREIKHDQKKVAQS